MRAASPTRRDFLRAGSVGAALAVADLAAASPRRDVNCIFLLLVGGPSQLDTWDPKPDAPTTIRGPFRPTRTNVPGVDLCEHFPRMATMADRFAVVRSLHHDAAPIHETGHQLLQTGRLAKGGVEAPHVGAVVSRLRGPRADGVPPFVVLPGPIDNTGVGVGHGQTAGPLGDEHGPAFLADLPAAVRDLRREKAAAYGDTAFGKSCRLARRLVERGARVVTVNMFDTVFNEVTWDCHADGGSLAVDLDDYRDTLCPMFDRAYAALLDDLHQRGLLDTTLVVAAGEFGRTPRLNPRGGRDHWPGVWSVLVAGGGVRGGQVVGASDRHGAEPKDRPVTPAELVATVYDRLGINGRPFVDAAPVRELT